MTEIATSTRAAIPVTIIGGYLGTGKTTLVNHLLRHAEGRRIAVLVNEFGALSIDEDLIISKDDKIISLTGGCVCCSYGSDFINALQDLAQLAEQPDVVLFEASGVALPAAIVSTVSLLPGFKVDGVIVVVDAETIQQKITDKYIGDTIRRQLHAADLLIINKTDLVNHDHLSSTRTMLQEIVSTAVQINSHRSAVPIEFIFQHPDNDYIRNDPNRHLAANTDRNKNRKSTERPHQHQLNFVTETLVPAQPIPAQQFVDQLFATYPKMVRAKGFIISPDHNVQTIQIVGKRVEVTPAPAGVSSGVVVISTL